MAALNCSVDGGNPMDYTLHWMKNGQQLLSTASVPAVYSAPYYQQQFGLFTCAVENDFYSINKSVLIQEKGKCCGSLFSSTTKPFFVASIHGLWLFIGESVLTLSYKVSETMIHRDSNINYIYC